MLKWSTAGESHGQSLIAIIEGLPAGLEFTTKELSVSLARRRLGYGRGARQRFEADEVTVLSGLRHGFTLGSPVAVEIRNSEWKKWTTVMSPDPVDPARLLINAGKGDEREMSRNLPLSRPRPGHADFAGMLKYGFNDARNVLERSSARETAARVALGSIAEALLFQVAGVRLVSHVVGLATVSVPLDAPKPTFADTSFLDNDPMRCFHVPTSDRMVDAMDEAKKNGDTLGGVVEVIAYGLPVGLGSYTQHETRLDACLAAAVMSIQAVKGVEIGEAFMQASLPGTQAHDVIHRVNKNVKTGQIGEIYRDTNYAGGIEGGMSNGAPIVVRGAVKPISTVVKALPTVDMSTGEEATGLHQRSDTSAVVPAAVIAQAEVALVLAQALMQKTGGDTVKEARDNLSRYAQCVTERVTWE